jgi:riboflavin synthase
VFTGIVRELGRVERFDADAAGYRLTVRSKTVCGDCGTGDSVAVNGVCLTVVSRKEGLLHFDVMGETVRTTNLKSLKHGDSVNLENALKVGDTMSGHLVLGHIDCVGMIMKISKNPDDIAMEVSVPDEFASLVVPKGSVAIDGVSLTVGGTKEAMFTAHLIPHTLRATNLGFKKPGDGVNIEFDIIGKYVRRFTAADRGTVLTEKFLKDRGFV